jgi:2-haloacid dehalogenase
VAAVVFDLGNVLIEWNPRRLLSDAFIEETHFFLWNAELDRGTPFADVVARVREEFPHHAEEVDVFASRWPETLGDVFEEVVVTAKQLRRRGHALYVMSNSSAETLPRSATVQDLLTQFDGALISGAVGLIKPDAAIFYEAEKLWALDPAATWFIDDSEPNVHGARAVGWNAIHFTDAAGLRAALNQAGLL